jgi:triosephosphate isomerase
MNADRRPIVAGNWKMNTTLSEARELAGGLRGPLDALETVDTVLCPPFISLAAVGETIAGSRVALGAQNCHFEAKGAFTGEVAAPMLANLGCRYVILGHSERRQYFGETDELVARKLGAVLANGMIPIVCVGENLQQNEAGQTQQVVGGQVRGSLAGLTPQQLAGLVAAYEPVWAIGTGRAASAADANATIGFIRQTLAELAGPTTARAVRIQYGGSVTPANAAELFAQPEIDGALVGGASLKAPDFTTICQAARR